MQHTFDLLFKPASVAVIGASNQEGSVGHAVMQNLLEAGFSGDIVPINLKPVHFKGLTSYPSISAVPNHVDLALIMVPAAAVPAVLQQAAAAGTRAAVIISAGFRETGEDGAALEQQVINIARHYGVTVVGPNCIGVINPHHHLNASFAGSTPAAGNVALISQSGALGTALIDSAAHYGIGFSKFITTGNKAAIDDGELLTYLANDKETDVIVMYAESLSQRADWVPLARRITGGSLRKPIIVLKAGATARGASAARSHTGSLTGDEAVYQAFFAQSGITQVHSIESMLQTAALLSGNPIPKAPAVILTNAGGPGIVAADAASNANLPLAQLEVGTIDHLRSFLPPAAAVGNPVDILGDADSVRSGRALDVVASDAGVGSIIVIVTPQHMTAAEKIARVIAEVRVSHSHLTFVAALVGGALLDSARSVLRGSGIVVVDYPENAVAALAAAYRASSSPASEKFKSVTADVKTADQAIVQALHDRRTSLLPDEAATVLQCYNIRTAQGKVVHSAVEASAAAHALAKPVVLKIVSPDILHKTEAGGVVMPVSPAHAAAAYRDLIVNVRRLEPAARIDGVLVQRLIPMEQELIVGAKRDAVFGPVVLVGLGGIYVEVLKDVATRVAPIGINTAEAMIRSLRSAPLLIGTRGQAGVDVGALADCIIKVSEIMMQHPEISEIDLNPVVAGAPGDGIDVLDARILLKSQ